jgi:perosamine synthetase
VINLGEPTFDDNEIQAVVEVIASNWVAGQGPTSRRFEDEFAAYCGASSSIALNNCTAGLHLALKALNIGPGDEVIVADYTYPATGHSVMYVGATPIFCDIRPDTWTIDVAAAEGLLTPRTRAIIAVDVAGQPADYEELSALASKHNLFIIQDAACSAGATYNNRKTGAPELADVSLFSFHGRKGITCGEGGAATARSSEVLEKMRRLSCFGVESALSRQLSEGLHIPQFVELGYNYKLSDLASGIMSAQLRKLDRLIARRNEIARYYDEALSTSELIETPTRGTNRSHSFQTYTVTLDRKVSRNEVILKMRSRGVGCNIGTYSSHVQPVYQSKSACPVANDLWTRHLAIPMHANLSESDLEQVLQILTEVVQSESRGFL